jgi:hypothetical protein
VPLFGLLANLGDVRRNARAKFGLAENLTRALASKRSIVVNANGGQIATATLLKAGDKFGFTLHKCWVEVAKVRFFRLAYDDNGKNP